MQNLRGVPTYSLEMEDGGPSMLSLPSLSSVDCDATLYTLIDETINPFFN